MVDHPFGPRIVRFDEFEVDVEAGELRRSGTVVRLQDKPFQILLALLERPGTVVTRGALRNRLWPPDTFVDFDHSLNTAINKLRAALQDEASQPRYIASVARKGYRFIARVDAVAPSLSTTRRPRTARVAATSVILLTLFIAALSLRLAPAPALPPADTVLIADLANLTADPVFDGTLKHTLATKLSETPFFKIVSPDHVSETLRLMTRRVDERVTGSLARDVCQRAGATAVVGGDIAALGSRYVIGLTAIACETGDTLAHEQIVASRKDDVLGAVDRATMRLRAKLGESLRSIEARNTPLAQATTSSLDALKAFSLGEARFVQGAQFEAIPFYERAIELDPDFALAHAKLGVVYGNRGERRLHIEALTKAFALRDRVGEREKFYISAHYYRLIKGDVERSRALYEVWSETYPRDARPHTSLGIIHMRAGDAEKATARFKTALQLDPVAFQYSNLTGALLDFGDLARARTVVAEWQRRLGESVAFHRAALLLAFIDGDVPSMQRHAAAVSGLPDEPAMLGELAQAMASLGRMREARDLWDRQVEIAMRRGLTDVAALALAVEALWEAEVGNVRQARELVSRSLVVSPTINVRAMAVIILARTGDGRKAAAVLGQIDPEVTLFSHVPGWALLASGRREDALEAMVRRNPYWGAPGGGVAGQQHELATRYARGHAHLAMRAGRKAADEFRSIADQPSIAALAPYHALVWLHLARAHAVAGETEQPTALYRRFLDRWANADDDLPLLQQAKAEFARLNSFGSHQVVPVNQTDAR